MKNFRFGQFNSFSYTCVFVAFNYCCQNYFMAKMKIAQEKKEEKFFLLYYTYP